MEDKHFSIEILDPQRLKRVNNLKPIENPIYFSKSGVPTSDGLLSNEIFGLTKDDRANVFAYIDLTDWFIHPYLYKIWNKREAKIRGIVHGTTYVNIDSNGYLVEDPNGYTGLKWLKANANNIKIKSTDSVKRDIDIQILNENKDKLFIREMIVIPAYYRDVNNNGHYISVGEISKLYDNLIIAVRALKETQDYGLKMGDAAYGRVQEILLDIYEWFKDGSMPNSNTKGVGISHKEGYLRRANMSKTSDYAARLVISAPELKTETVDNMMVNLDQSAVPLSALCANLFPFMTFYIRRFFENEFAGITEYPYYTKDGELKYTRIKDPLIEFSDTRIKKEIERFMKGYSNRFIPIELPTEDNKTIFMRFKGRNTSVTDVKIDDKNQHSMDDPEKGQLINRRMTWCDLIYMAAVECAKDKYVLITRFPVDSYFNQFPTKIVVSSTKETEEIYVGSTFYPYYPKIREEDIGSDTSNKFIDTMRMSNLYLKAIGGDYDGDQVTCKVAFTTESNKELEEFCKSKKNYITLGCKNVRVSSNECIQSLYNLTLILPETKLIDPKF